MRIRELQGSYLTYPGAKSGQPTPARSPTNSWVNVEGSGDPGTFAQRGDRTFDPRGRVDEGPVRRRAGDPRAGTTRSKSTDTDPVGVRGPKSEGSGDPS